MQIVSCVPGIHYFCYQAEPKGTGNAAKTAAVLLKDNPSIDDVLVIAGDTFIELDILQKLIDNYHKTSSDLSFVVCESTDFKSLGHVVYDNDGSIAGIAEAPDIAKMQFLIDLRKITNERDVSARECEDMAKAYLKSDKKAAGALGAIWEDIKTGTTVTKELLRRNFTEEDFLLRVNKKNLQPEALLKIKYANLSIYLFRKEHFLDSLEKLDSNNVQKEEYITDTVAILAGNNKKITVLPVANPHQVMTYNTPEEIREIELYLSEQRITHVTGT